MFLRCLAIILCFHGVKMRRTRPHPEAFTLLSGDVEMSDGNAQGPRGI